MTALRKVAQINCSGLAVHDRGGRKCIAVKLERGPVEGEVGPDCVGEHDVRCLGSNVELHVPCHRLALGIDRTPLVARDVAVFDRKRHNGRNTRELDLDLVGIEGGVRVQLHLEVDAQRNARRMPLEPLLGVGDIEDAVGNRPRRLVGATLVVQVGLGDVGHHDVRREHIAQTRRVQGEHALVDAALDLALHLRVRCDGHAQPGRLVVVGNVELHAIGRGVTDGNVRGTGVVLPPWGNCVFLGSQALLAFLHAGVDRGLRLLLSVGSTICRIGVAGSLDISRSIGCNLIGRHGCRCIDSILRFSSLRLTCGIGGICLLGNNRRIGERQLLSPSRRHPACEILKHENHAEEQRQGASPHWNRHRSTSSPRCL